MLISDVYCWYLIPGMVNNPCTDKCHKMLTGVDESTVLCPMIIANEILYSRWKVLPIKSINMLVSMVIGNFWKLLLLLFRYISQWCGYVLESVQNDLIGCEYEFLMFTVSVVRIILCALIICWIVKPKNWKYSLYWELPQTVNWDWRIN